jgi:hypothetical protein
VDRLLSFLSLSSRDQRGRSGGVGRGFAATNLRVVKSTVKRERENRFLMMMMPT